MDDKELARLVAADLGTDVAAAVANPERDATRAFGLGETMAVGSFILSGAQLAVQIWQARQDRALLVLALADALDGRPELASCLDPERRLGILGRVVNKLVPERFGSSPSLPRDGRQTKQEWMRAWVATFDASREADPTRAMSKRVLEPSPDWDTFTLHKPIYWTPDSGAPDLPPMITVPAGFVTNLASIPPYFWWAITPMGRHGDAAIIHDWLYTEQNVPREVADRVFEVVMAELGVALPVRKVMWAAVRVFGGSHWDAARAGKQPRRV